MEQETAEESVFLSMQRASKPVTRLSVNLTSDNSTNLLTFYSNVSISSLLSILDDLVQHMMSNCALL